jgi:hypothetical protein
MSESFPVLYSFYSEKKNRVWVPRCVSSLYSFRINIVSYSVRIQIYAYSRVSRILVASRCLFVLIFYFFFFASHSSVILQTR